MRKRGGEEKREKEIEIRGGERERKKCVDRKADYVEKQTLCGFIS